MVDSKTEAFNDIAKAIAGTVIARFLCIFQAISVFRFFLFPTWKFSSCCCYFNWFLTATASRIIHSPHEVERIASKCLDLFEKIVDTHTLCRAQTACTEEKWEQERNTGEKWDFIFGLLNWNNQRIGLHYVALDFSMRSSVVPKTNGKPNEPAHNCVRYICEKSGLLFGTLHIFWLATRMFLQFNIRLGCEKKWTWNLLWYNFSSFVLWFSCRFFLVVWFVWKTRQP